MRIISAALSLVLLAAAGLAGKALWDVLRNPPDSALVIAAPVSRPAVSSDSPTPSGAVARRHWPALFGERRAPEPLPPAPPPPQPPRPPAPPIASLGFRLQGVVSAGAVTWAIVSHPAGDRILKVGDTLTDGITVVGIDDAGLWLNRDDERILLGFEAKEH